MKYFSNSPPGIFLNPEYIHFVVEYNGDLAQEASISPMFYITILSPKYAIISTPKPTLIKVDYSIDKKLFPSITYISRYNLFTLQDLSPITAANINLVQIQPPFYLTGKGVLVGIIDTGIDYLNKEFMNSDGSTRIKAIWDQTIIPPSTDPLVPFGQLFNSETINNAIKAYNENKDPYEIVPSKDTNGHGTSMAGVIGAKGINPEIIGAAPNCEFVVVKLYEAVGIKNFFLNIPVYDLASIVMSLNFLYQYALTVNKPMVIYLPLGTNFGNHKGDGLLENFINTISNNTGIVVVTGAGNEGSGSGHASGKITLNELYQDIPFNVSNNQNFLSMEIWTSAPNLMSLEIISSSGETSGIIPYYLKKPKEIKYIFEETTTAVVQYFLPDEFTGNELILINYFSLTPGIWKLRLHGNYILDGYYNVWMLQRGLAIEDTGFTYPDPYGTFTGPGSSEYIVTVANYNQNNFNIVPSSGLSFLNDYYNAVDIAAGGINAKTPSINGGTTTISGTSVSAAVVAGACAILLEWGIVNGNDPTMYSQKIKTYLLRGTNKRPNGIYPNAEWGYGILDLLGVFRYLE